jgi:hypothetical protein
MIQTNIYDNQIDFQRLEETWKENAAAKNKKGHLGNKEILISLITNIDRCSNSQLYSFMNRVGIRADGGWFKKESNFFGLVGAQETERAKLFRAVRGIDIETFFKTQSLQPTLSSFQN